MMIRILHALTMIARMSPNNHRRRALLRYAHLIDEVAPKKLLPMLR